MRTTHDAPWWLWLAVPVGYPLVALVGMVFDTWIRTGRPW